MIQTVKLSCWQAMPFTAASQIVGNRGGFKPRNRVTLDALLPVVATDKRAQEDARLLLFDTALTILPLEWTWDAFCRDFCWRESACWSWQYRV